MGGSAGAGAGTATRDVARPKGGAWALEATPAAEVFTPEDLSDLQRDVARTVRDFVRGAVRPALPAMEAQDLDLVARLLRQAGELGLTGLEVPERWGGLGLDQVTSALVLEEVSAGGGSFTATFGAHTGIGTLPILYFGDAAQRDRYLPALARAEKIGAYCLTEAGSGSDALAARTTARRSPDGRQWILNGTKQWITNGGIADLFVVYAKIDGEHFSAFIVERDAPGLSTGKEERKMGLHGSSTRSVILEDCLIPAENLLHEPGKGHQVAFNILNIGRFKLGAGTVGGAKHALATATGYARERRQFGKALVEFPLIQQKLAEMAVRIYAAESASYRTAALLDAGLAGIDHDAPDAGRQSVAAIREYAVECSVMKVLGSEVLDYVVDEAVQIHGGYGFMEELEVCRAYRDSRINRIFEGTNEINRMLITGDLLKRGLQGDLPVLAAAARLQQELLTVSPPTPDGSTPLQQERWLVEAGRKIALLVAGLAVQRHQMALEHEQELLAGIADLLIDTYAMESALLRTEKHPSEARDDLAVAFAHDAFGRIEGTARLLLAALEEGDALRTQLAVLRRLTRRDPVDSLALKRRIAARVVKAGGYAA
jgi:alkylation response protein AidB-like acyl-CoA dehydrogenase